ncbi:hypothetical protein LV704_00820 [Flagellimonas sp. CMM7]|nr:hypothetical protein LV704_00820 [Flagellimonas sp. CMM7]
MREVSPLRTVEEAMDFDNSDIGLEEQFERTHNHAHRVLTPVPQELSSLCRRVHQKYWVVLKLAH